MKSENGDLALAQPIQRNPWCLLCVLVLGNVFSGILKDPAPFLVLISNLGAGETQTQIFTEIKLDLLTTFSN